MARLAALGLDLGTSGLDGVAVDDRGELLAEVTHDYPLLTPQPGWTEQEPAAWWQAARSALSELASRVTEYEVAAIGLSGQMHGMVPLDAAGAAVRPAILWNDQRTVAAVGEIERRIPRGELVERTGNPAITGFQLAKVLWLRGQEPSAFAATRQILFPKDYLGFRLTGELYAEPTDASGSNAFNVHALAWDGDLLRSLDLDTSLWPTIVPSKAVVGRLRPTVADELGLRRDVSVVAGAGDNAAAAYGLGLGRSRPELGNVSLGTSGVLFAAQDTAAPDPQGRVHLFCHADGGYQLLGVTLSAAGSLRWFRDALAPGRSFAELLEMASTVEPGAAGVTFKPYLSGERTPFMDGELRGSFHGLSLAAGLPEMARSVIEGVAFALRDALTVMRPLTRLERALATGGGAASGEWLRIVSDVLQLPLHRPAEERGAAYGAARLALEATGGPPPVVPSHGQEVIEPGPFARYADAYERFRQYGPPIER